MSMLNNLVEVSIKISVFLKSGPIIQQEVLQSSEADMKQIPTD